MERVSRFKTATGQPVQTVSSSTRAVSAIRSTLGKLDALNLRHIWISETTDVTMRAAEAFEHFVPEGESLPWMYLLCR